MRSESPLNRSMLEPESTEVEAECNSVGLNATTSAREGLPQPSV